MMNFIRFKTSTRTTTQMYCATTFAVPIVAQLVFMVLGSIASKITHKSKKTGYYLEGSICLALVTQVINRLYFVATSGELFILTKTMWDAGQSDMVVTGWFYDGAMVAVWAAVICLINLVFLVKIAEILFCVFVFTVDPSGAALLFTITLYAVRECRNNGIRNRIKVMIMGVICLVTIVWQLWLWVPEVVEWNKNGHCYLDGYMPAMDDPFDRYIAISVIAQYTMLVGAFRDEFNLVAFTAMSMVAFSNVTIASALFGLYVMCDVFRNERKVVDMQNTENKED